MLFFFIFFKTAELKHSMPVAKQGLLSKYSNLHNIFNVDYF